MLHSLMQLRLFIAHHHHHRTSYCVPLVSSIHAPGSPAATFANWSCHPFNGLCHSQDSLSLCTITNAFAPHVWSAETWMQRIYYGIVISLSYVDSDEHGSHERNNIMRRKYILKFHRDTRCTRASEEFALCENDNYLLKWFYEEHIDTHTHRSGHATCFTTFATPVGAKWLVVCCRLLTRARTLI